MFGFALTVAQGASGSALASTVSGCSDATTGTDYGTTYPGALTWTFAAGAATLNAPQTIPAVPGSLGGTWTATYSSGSLSVSDGMLLWTAAGSALFVNGESQTCPFTQSFTCTTD